MPDSDFYSSVEVAAMLGVTRMTLHNWRKSKEPIGPPFIIIAPKIIRYRKTRVDAFIDAAERGVRFDRRQGHPSIASRMAAKKANAERGA